MNPAGASSNERGGRRGKAYAWLTVFLLMAAFLLSMLDRTILSLMVEPIQRDFGITDTQFGLLLGFAFALFYSIAGIPLGWLVDHCPRTRLLAAAIALWSVATVLTGFSSRFAYLFLARVGVGVGEATLNPAAYSLMADLFDARQLSRAIAIFYLGSTFGLGGAYLFGGALASMLGSDTDIVVPVLGQMHIWQMAFVLAGAPGIVLALVFLLLKEPARAPQVRADEGSWSELWRFVGAERKTLSLLILAFCALNTSTYAIWGWAPASLSRTHHLDPASVGVILAIAAGGSGGAGLILGGALSDWWQKRLGAGAPMILGAVAVSLSVPFAAGYTLGGDYMLASVCLCLQIGLLFLTIPGALAALQLATPAPLRGRVSAIFMMIVTLVGVSTGPLLVGLLNDRMFGDQDKINLSLAAVFGIFLPFSALAFLAAARPLAVTISKSRSHP